MIRITPSFPLEYPQEQFVGDDHLQTYTGKSINDNTYISALVCHGDINYSDSCHII